MRTFTTFPLAALLVLSLSCAAYAAAPKGDAAPGDAKGRAYGNLTQAQHDKLRAMYKDFFAKTAPLRDQLSAKKMELRAIQNLPATTQADVVKVIDSITALRGQLREQRMAFMDALDKEGLPAFGGHGMGMGHGRHGGMMGMGGMGMGGMMGGGCPMMGMSDGPGYDGEGMGHDGSGHGGRHMDRGDRGGKGMDRNN